MEGRFRFNYKNCTGIELNSVERFSFNKTENSKVAKEV